MVCCTPCPSGDWTVGPQPSPLRTQISMTFLDAHTSILLPMPMEQQYHPTAIHYRINSPNPHT
eukprot:192179-Amphidinium_carterae.1